MPISNGGLLPDNKGKFQICQSNFQFPIFIPPTSYKGNLSKTDGPLRKHPNDCQTKHLPTSYLLLISKKCFLSLAVHSFWSVSCLFFLWFWNKLSFPVLFSSFTLWLLSIVLVCILFNTWHRMKCQKCVQMRALNQNITVLRRIRPHLLCILAIISSHWSHWSSLLIVNGNTQIFYINRHKYNYTHTHIHIYINININIYLYMIKCWCVVVKG